MTIQTITYDDCKLLPCAGCSPSEIIICVPSEIVAPVPCPPETGSIVVSPTNQTVLRHFIEATLVSTVKIPDGCGGFTYRYVIQYDDAQLSDPTTSLVCGLINGIFCKNCLTQWVEDLVGIPVVVQENTPGIITVINQYGCAFSFDISPPGLICTDTPTVDLTCGVDVNGNYTIEGDVILSDDAGNILEERVDGLYAPTPVIPAQFISSINIPAGCLTVSAGSMVRQFSVAAGVLTITSAPEHTTVGNGGTVFDGAVTETTLLSVGLTNPSACRSLNGLITHTWGYNYIQTSTPGNPLVEVAVNGLPYVPTDNIAAINTGVPTDALNGKAVATATSNFTIGPSVLLVETRRQRVIAPGGGSTHTPQTWGTALILFGSTV